MFERYTEKARRVIFFARYEASQWGDSFIQPAHLLLGILREEKDLLRHLLNSDDPFRNVADDLKLKVVGEKLSTSVDLPLSQESKQVLVFAAEEAESLGHSNIGSAHLLLGLCREPGPVSELFAKRGFALPALRTLVKEMPLPVTREHQLKAQLFSVSEYAKVIGNLRMEFGAALRRHGLKPEWEPAVVYRVAAEKTK